MSQASADRPDRSAESDAGPFRMPGRLRSPADPHPELAAVASGGFHALPCPAAVIDRFGRVLVVNGAWRSEAGRLPELVGVDSDYLAGCRRAGASRLFCHDVREVLDGAVDRVDLEQLLGADGGRCVRVQVQACADGREQRRAVVLHLDISGQRLAQRELLHAATHDALTGAVTRRVLISRIEQALVRAQRYDEPFALLYLDLDNFKAVNDTFGHRAGDRVLSELVARWQQVLRGADVIARVGGDEFVVLVEHARASRAAQVAQRLLDAAAAPIALAREGVVPEVSVGIAHPTTAGSPEDAIEIADRAMYAVKATRWSGASSDTDVSSG